MKISLNWLSQYIDLSGLSVDEMSDMLTFAGIEVEDIRQQGVDSHTWWWPAWPPQNSIPRRTG